MGAIDKTLPTDSELAVSLAVLPASNTASISSLEGEGAPTYIVGWIGGFSACCGGNEPPIAG